MQVACRWPEPWGCRAKRGGGTSDHTGEGLLAGVQGRGGVAAGGRAPQQEGEGGKLSPHALPLAKSKEKPMPCCPGLDEPLQTQTRRSREWGAQPDLRPESRF